MSHQPSLPNIPWEERPAGCAEVIWRYSANPIIPRNLIPSANSIFNSAVVPFNGAYAGVFRCDNKKREMNLHRGFSQDGIHWQLDDAPIDWQFADPELSRFVHRYDPRVVWLEDRYYVTWCNGYHGPTIGIGFTFDFETFTFLENALLPFNRNGVLFPRRINGKYVMFSRPSDNGHTPFGDIFLSQSPDLIHWGEHRFVMGVKDGWQSTKIGAGPVPIETDEGWLLIYHGVLTSCNGFAADPLRVRRRRAQRGLPLRRALRRAHRPAGGLLRRRRHRHRPGLRPNRRADRLRERDVRDLREEVFPQIYRDFGEG